MTTKGPLTARLVGPHGVQWRSPRVRVAALALIGCALLAVQPSALERDPLVLAGLTAAALLLSPLAVRLPGVAAPLSLCSLLLLPTWLLGTAWLAALVGLAGRGVALLLGAPSRLPREWQLASTLLGVACGGLAGSLGLRLAPGGESSVALGAAGFALGFWGGQTLTERLSPWADELAPTWLLALLNSLVLFPPAYFLADIGRREDKIPFAISLGLAVGLAVLVRALTNSETRTAELEEEAASTADARDRLELIVDHAPEAIFGMHRDGSLLWLNRTAVDWIGERAEQAVGQPANAVVPLRDAVGEALDHQELLARAASTGHPIHQEGLLESAPGAPERVLASYSVVREAEDDGLGVVLLRDATLVGETLREQEELAVHLSHELRAPLTTILGYAQLISNPGATNMVPNAQSEFARRISESGDYMLRLVNNLLDLGQLTRTDAEGPALQPVDVAVLTRDAVEALRPQAEEKGQQLRLDSSLTSLVITSSDLAVRQIITNLVANAIKYTPPNGSVQVELAADQHELTWRVRDSGIGLSPDEQRRLFTKFFRSQRPEARLIKGTGLGLALTKALVDRLGGTIEVESVMDQGSTFTVRLPRAA